MLKGIFIGILLSVVVALGGAYAIVRLGVIPAAANGKPIFLENWAAKTSLHATLARDAPKGPNPVPLTDVNLIKGINLFAQHCAICHGTAQGDASRSPVARGEYPQPPQFASHGVEGDPVGWTFWKIRNGIRWTAMPSWRPTLDDQQMWTLALFLKHMDKLPPNAQQVWQHVKH